MVFDSPNSKLTKALTDVDESLIDTFSDFPTPQALDAQISDRILGDVFGISYYSKRADYNAECSRSRNRGSRIEVRDTLAYNREDQLKMVGLVNRGER